MYIKKLFTLFILILLSLSASATIKFSIESKPLTPGTTVEIPVYYWGDEDNVAMQTTVEATGGLQLVSAVAGETISNTDLWEFDCKIPKDPIILLTAEEDDIILQNGEMFIITVKVPEDFVEGEIKLLDNVGSTVDFESIYWDDLIVKFTAAAAETKPILYCSNVVLEAGKENQVVPIYFKNYGENIALQTDINASEGIKIISLKAGSMIANTADWECDSKLPNHPKVLVSYENDDARLGEGEIFLLTVSVDKGCTEGELRFTDNLSTTPDFKSIEMDDVTVPVTITSSTAISTAKVATAASYYNVNGQLVSGKQHGINIIRMADGSVKKAINK